MKQICVTEQELEIILTALNIAGGVKNNYSYYDLHDAITYEGRVTEV